MGEIAAIKTRMPPPQVGRIKADTSFRSDNAAGADNMRMNKRALGEYGSVKVQADVASSDRVGLIKMMFDALIDTLVMAEAQIQRNDINGKWESISRASRIVLGLQASLDHEKGGELASNLDELYAYVSRRLIHANANNDAAIIVELRGLMGEIREAWATIQPPVDASISRMAA
jgi:flagellar protein FliS